MKKRSIKVIFVSYISLLVPFSTYALTIDLLNGTGNSANDLVSCTQFSTPVSKALPSAGSVGGGVESFMP